jgi:ABC-type nitrate/sulfonate/bicarbonate transport system permease component
LAVVGAVVAEWIGGENGIALILLQADALLQTSLAIAALIILAALGGAFYALIALAEMALSPRRTAQGATYS